MGVNMSIPAAYDECLSQTEQLEWLYKHKENLLTAGANIKITRSGDTVVIAAEGEGFSPTVNVEVIPGGHRVTITDGEGPHVFDVMDGAPGQDGTDGTDGTSVSFSTQSIQGGTRVFLEDGTHSSSFDVMDGTDGEDITITDVSVISAGTQVTFSDDTVIVIPNGLTGPQGLPGVNGRNVFVKYADAQPTQDSDMKDLPSAFMGVYSGTATTAPSTYTDYLWYQIKGTKGDTGSQGPAGVSPSLSSEPISGGHRVSMTDAEGTTTFDVMDGENAAAATVTVGSTTTGQPGSNASVTNSGTSSDAVLDFVIPRGLQGPQGEKGDTGDTGPAGTTPSITVTATADATSSDNPSVTVTKSGTDAAPTFAMAFSGLKGAAGAAGQGVPAGGSGNQVLAKVNATDYNTQWKTIGLIPTGGTSGQVLTKTGSSNYQMSWSTPTGRLPDYPYGALVADETGTAVWLGPNNVDPTLDVGKVLTLKDVAESGMPPQIIPQWEAAGGGSGGGGGVRYGIGDAQRGRMNYVVTIGGSNVGSNGYTVVGKPSLVYAVPMSYSTVNGSVSVVADKKMLSASGSHFSYGLSSQCQIIPGQNIEITLSSGIMGGGPISIGYLDGTSANVANDGDIISGPVSCLLSDGSGKSLALGGSVYVDANTSTIKISLSVYYGVQQMTMQGELDFAFA